VIKKLFPLIVCGTILGAQAGYCFRDDVATQAYAPDGTEIGMVTRNIPSGTQDVNIVSGGVSGNTGIAEGRKIVTTAGTRVALAASTACNKVDIVALATNTGTVVVGGAGVIASAGTRVGVPLRALDSITIDIDNLSDVWIDSTVNGEGVTFTYYT
jgi:hypothetical protein